MAESGASASPSGVSEKNDMRPDSALSEAMDMDVNVAAVDASPPDETLNTGPSEVDVVTSLREEENMGSKGMSVDESHRSEAGTPSQAPAPIESLPSKGLSESRAELLERVQTLKKDLENWRGRMDTQVKSYKEELSGLRTSLNSEVEHLRAEFQDLRNTLKQQREATPMKLMKLDQPAETPTSPKLPLPVSNGEESCAVV
ncbi:hypothetical protein M758_8G082900 [Ceratodon purpureus]|uniref:Uncharacterized protein n=1 Tax=Ceratodon purpureus TaxID=3225 RepID=A0A8T0H173_CERPU|nr:hypothetical protein KC19_8G087300 [Ceratodon purpureus]KAG0608153.1 hypothetical protein M758_8G082900 [Ceratodon purpureus]